MIASYIFCHKKCRRIDDEGCHRVAWCCYCNAEFRYRGMDYYKGYICPSCGKVSIIDDHGHSKTMPIDMEHFKRKERLGTILLILAFIMPLFLASYSWILAAVAFLFTGFIGITLIQDKPSESELRRAEAVGRLVRRAGDGSMLIAPLIANDEEQANSICDALEDA